METLSLCNNKFETVRVTNQDIVSYNPYLLMRYQCHVCADVVTASSIVKCLYKYVHKGVDFARAKVGTIVNEIEQYRNARYVAASEAIWRMFGFQTVSRNPAVTCAHVHLENEQPVQIPGSATPAERVTATDKTKPDLMKYFDRSTGNEFDTLTMLDYYEKYTVQKCRSSARARFMTDSYGNSVRKCTRTVNKHASRLALKTADQGDVFFLRLLLHHKTARSFEDLRTINGVLHEKFERAGRALGIVSGHEEYKICMQEAATYRTGKQLRGLFVTLVLHGGTANELWHQFQNDLTQDLHRTVTVEQAKTYALQQFDLHLQKHGKANADVGLPSVVHVTTEYQRMMQEFDTNSLNAYTSDHESCLTTEQQLVYHTVLSAVRSRRQKVCMIDAPAGTGKTFTEQVIAARLRSENKLVLIAASIGIAALQLPGGWTAHSMFKLPIEIDNTAGSVCNIRAEWQRAEVLRTCNLIIWDELPMAHRFNVEALDLTLKDLTQNTLPFGGKCILFSGDWRQIGPVVRFGSEQDMEDASLMSSDIWPHVDRMRLTISQRDKSDAAYASFVRHVGEGKITQYDSGDGTPVIPLAHNLQSASCPSHAFVVNCTDNFEDLISFVYPDLHQAKTALLAQRAILSAINATIDSINSTILQRLPGDVVTLRSYDRAVKMDPRDAVQNPFASPENLNSINITGMPPHKLTLKKSSLVMITRNLNFSEEMVNGQKAEVLDLSAQSRVLPVRLLDESDKTILLPRISFNAQVGRNGITFTRLQFPVRPAYACTTNKSQGQTLTKVGLDLRSPVFAHGQLYVALSRAQGGRGVLCFVDKSFKRSNIAFTGNVTSSPFVAAATGEMPTPQKQLKSIITYDFTENAPRDRAPSPAITNLLRAKDSDVEETKINWPP